MPGLFLTFYLTEIRKISQEDFPVPRQTWVETWITSPIAGRGLEDQDNLKVCAKALGQWGFPETERSLEHWETEGEVLGLMLLQRQHRRTFEAEAKIWGLLQAPWEVREACMPETAHIKCAIFKIPHFGPMWRKDRERGNRGRKSRENAILLVAKSVKFFWTIGVVVDMGVQDTLEGWN